MPTEARAPKISAMTRTLTRASAGSPALETPRQKAPQHPRMTMAGVRVTRSGDADMAALCRLAAVGKEVEAGVVPGRSMFVLWEEFAILFL